MSTKYSAVKIVKYLKNKLVSSNHLIISVLALFFGTLYSVYLIREKIIPTEVDWLFNKEDPSTYQIGWLYLRHDSWHWPLTFTDYLAYPTGASISYTDSIPLFAIIFKLFSGVLPDNFQYFGIFILLSFILQFFWGAQLGLLFARENLFFSIGAGILFMLSPTLLWRVSGHFALTSHWLILAAIWSYFKLKTFEVRKVFLIQTAIVAFASGVNPYIAVMSLALIVIAYFEQWLCRRISFIKTFTLIISLVLILLSGWSFFGYLSNKSAVGNVYGLYSLNLASLFNSMSLSTFLSPVPIQGDQYEGFSYLGFGVLLLLFTNVIAGVFKHRINSKILTEVTRENRLLIVGAVFLTLFALSNRVFWQDILIFEYPLPASISNLLGTFRASGRLFWPVYYLILLSIIISTFKLWTRQQAKFLLILIITIQFLDLVPLQSFAAGWVHTKYPSSLASKDWSQLGKEHNKLIVLPSYQCGFLAEFPTFEKLAALQGLKTNSAYLARYSRSQIQTHCEQLPRQVASGQLESDAAYVLERRKYFKLYTSINKNKDSSHYCDDVDGFVLCRKRTSLLEQGSIGLKVPPYSIGSVLRFVEDENVSAYQFGDWSMIGADGTWTDGSEASLLMQIKEPVKDGLLLNVEALPYINEKHPKQVVDVLVNDQLLNQWVFQFNTQQSIKPNAFIPANLINGRSLLKITFRFLEPVSPQSLGESEDVRQLGLFFQKLQLSDISYPIEKVLNFSESNTSLKYQIAGWSIVEPTGTWTHGTEASLLMSIEEPVKNGLLLNVEALPYINEKHPKQVVDVLVNEHKLTQWVFQNGAQQLTRRSTLIPADLVNRQSPIRITFRFLEPVSPNSLGESEDKRLLGLFFQKLQLSQAKAPQSSDGLSSKNK